MIRCIFFLTSVCIDFNHALSLFLDHLSPSFLPSSLPLNSYTFSSSSHAFRSLSLFLLSPQSSLLSLITPAFPFLFPSSSALHPFMSSSSTKLPPHPPISLTSLLPFFRLLYFLLLPFALGVAHGEEEQPALFCSSGLSSLCRTQMVIMELHINWLCWKLTVAVKGSRQPVPLCPCARWCIGSSWWTRCLHSAQLLLRSAQKWYERLSDLYLFVFQPVPCCFLPF